MAGERRRVDKEIRLKAGEIVLLDVVEDGRTIRVRVVGPRPTDNEPDGDAPVSRKTTPNTKAAAAKRTPAKRTTERAVAAKRSAARNVAAPKAARRHA